MPRHKAGWDGYEIRDGGDGKPGIYTRDYNCRLATFNANTYALQQALTRLFDDAHKRAQKPAKPKRRRSHNVGAFSGDIGDQGYRPIKMPTRP